MTEQLKSKCCGAEMDCEESTFEGNYKMFCCKCGNVCERTPNERPPECADAESVEVTKEHEGLKYDPDLLNRIPQVVRDAARIVDDYFARHCMGEWEFRGIASRKLVFSLQSELAKAQERIAYQSKRIWKQCLATSGEPHSYSEMHNACIHMESELTRCREALDQTLSCGNGHYNPLFKCDCYKVAHDVVCPPNNTTQALQSTARAEELPKEKK